MKVTHIQFDFQFQQIKKYIHKANVFIQKELQFNFRLASGFIEILKVPNLVWLCPKISTQDSVLKMVLQIMPIFAKILVLGDLPKSIDLSPYDFCLFFREKLSLKKRGLKQFKLQKTKRQKILTYFPKMIFNMLIHFD